jgi:glycosyltransferase involved in cell wall biosynthesis
MDYEPNESAALWVLANVWPSVLARVPDATLWIVGANPTDRLRTASASFASVHVTGSVPEVAPYLWKAAVSIAPMFISRGMQNKVVEAVAAGLPVVVTPQVMAGLPVEVRPACTEAADAVRFSQAILHLLETAPDARRRTARQADLGRLTWENCLHPLKDILIAASRSRSIVPEPLPPAGARARQQHHATGRQAASARPETPVRDGRTSSS